MKGSSTVKIRARTTQWPRDRHARLVWAWGRVHGTGAFRGVGDKPCAHPPAGRARWCIINTSEEYDSIVGNMTKEQGAVMSRAQTQEAATGTESGSTQGGT